MIKQKKNLRVYATMDDPVHWSLTPVWSSPKAREQQQFFVSRYATAVGMVVMWWWWLVEGVLVLFTLPPAN